MACSLKRRRSFPGARGSMPVPGTFFGFDFHVTVLGLSGSADGAVFLMQEGSADGAVS